MTGAWQLFLDDMGDLFVNGVRGWNFILLYAKPDLEVKTVSWGAPSHNAGGELCADCRANRTAMPYADLRVDARWRSSLITSTVEYKARFRLPRHPLACSHYFDLHFFANDLMHTCDCNGVAGHMAGSVMRPLVVNEARLGANQTARMKAINDLMRDFYTRNPGSNRCPDIKVNNLTDSVGYSNLSGAAFKAANTRGLAPFLVELADQHCDSDSQKDRFVRRACVHWNAFYMIVYSSGMFMTTEQKSDLRTAVLRWGAAYQCLRELSVAEHKLDFMIVPKTRIMQHFGFPPNIINPRYIQNYLEESNIGTTTQIWQRSAR
eukprot:9471505-Pyramimonas_sp.AAC.1